MGTFSRARMAPLIGSCAAVSVRGRTGWLRRLLRVLGEAHSSRRSGIAKLGRAEAFFAATMAHEPGGQRVSRGKRYALWNWSPHERAIYWPARAQECFVLRTTERTGKESLQRTTRNSRTSIRSRS